MSETLPLFPLGTVLYPGVLLPLNIFEERYRQLVHDLLEGPEPGRFGVIAIRKGRETGVDGISALHEIGCTATLREVAEQDDGRFHLVTVGTQRFRLASLDDSRPYLQGEVELLEEEVGDEAAAGLAVQAVQRGFRGYVEALASRKNVEVSVPELPGEPSPLSYLVAATMVLDLGDHQSLLAAPDTATRLLLELGLLRRESALLRVLPSLPGVDYARQPASPN